MNEAKILIVDDEKDVREFLSYTLSKKRNFQIKTAQNGFEAINIFKEYKPDIILLDITMPKLDGIEACYKIRSIDKNNTIIIFLSARNEEYTQIASYDAGGDDFISKPIKPRLLLKKIDTIIKRKIPEKIIVKNGISINNSKHLVLLNNKKISLTKKQFQILTLLYNDNDVVYSREQIIQKVWDKDYYVTHRNVDVQIRKIREVIGNDKITTIKGLGYKFSSD
tara:strand:- start:165 stop:833 length:669 start_codon:yes stop_codon:yes gene_type:complete